MRKLLGFGSETSLEEQRNTDKSKRVMRREWGARPEMVKARRYYRALLKAEIKGKK